MCLLASHPMVLAELARLLGKRSRVVGRRIPIDASIGPFCREIPAARTYAVDACGSFPHDLTIVRGLLDRCPDARVLVVSESFTTIHAVSLLRLGVKGLLPYADVPRLFREAMENVGAGRLWVSRELATAFVDAVTRRAPETLHAAGTGLSRREQEVLRGIIDNRSNKEIGEQLHISERTAKFHVANLMRKLGVRRRSDIIAQWWQGGATLPAS